MYKKRLFKKGTLYFAMAVITTAAGLFLKIPVNAQRHLLSDTKIAVNKNIFPEETLRKKAASFDSNKDGMLSKAEIKKATSLSIIKFLDPDDVPENSKNPEYKKSDFVFNLEGIQHFTSLKKLEINLSGGITKKEGKHYDSILLHFDEVYKLKNLTSLKLYSAKQKNIDLSKLPKLKSVILNVPNLSKLTIDNESMKKFWLGDSTSKMASLDFQNAPNLTTLYLDNMQSANVIFGKKNTALQEMSITGNGKTEIKSLDITYLKNLKKLILRKINISDVDFSKNTNLENVSVDTCSMETLDFSKNEKLDWLACEGKKTKEIIIPENNVISTFKWVNANLDTFENEYLNPDTLTSIILFNNPIQSLDLTRYPNLSYVFVSKNVNVQLAPELDPNEIVVQ